MKALLEVEGLQIELSNEGRRVTVVREVDLEIAAGKAHGLIGESGSGKSMTAKAVAQLLPKGAKSGGQIRFGGQEIGQLAGKDLRRYRSEGVAMIFQDPRAHINPVRTIGDFLTESLRTNLGMKPKAALRRGAELLAEVGMKEGDQLMRQYPHELSGGMLQRVMIASALTANPRLLLADEPTTALDVTRQAEVVAILDRLRRERELALLFITHDLELATAICDDLSVMYAGTIIERQEAQALHQHPRHPYTAGLLGARPTMTGTRSRLPAIPGRPIAAFEAGAGCAFAPRCAFQEARCAEGGVPEPLVRAGAVVRCVRVDEIDPSVGDQAEEASTRAHR